MKTICTTAGRPDEQSFALVHELAEKLQLPIVERRKQSVSQLQNKYDAHVLIVGKDRLHYYERHASEPFFFHPNTAAFRVKRLVKGEADPIIHATNLQEGDTFLDCTLGFGADSIVASHVVGEKGAVKGIEAHPIIAFLTTVGLQTFSTDDQHLLLAMHRIQVQQHNAIDYLKAEPSNTWDVVYIDPMFQQPIEESTNFQSLRATGFSHALTQQWMDEAFRVCKKRVVVKDHFRSSVFRQFGLHQLIRPNTKFHFGILDKEKHRPKK